MPRYDEEDDYRDDPRPRKGTNPVLVVGLVVGGILFVGIAACVGISLVWVAKPQGAQQPAPVAAEKATSTPAGVTTGVPAKGATVRPTEVIDLVNPRIHLIDDFDANLVAADKKWLGKRVREMGNFAELRKDTSGKRKGLFYATFYQPKILVYLDPAHEDEWSKLRGGTIIFEATLAEYEQGTEFGILLIFDQARLVSSR
jgi:hypothetical protein